MKILICMEYKAKYGGNFLCSILSLEKFLLNDGAEITYGITEDSSITDFRESFFNGRNIFTFPQFDYKNIIKELSSNYDVAYFHFFSLDFVKQLAFSFPNTKFFYHAHNLSFVKLKVGLFHIFQNINNKPKNLYLIGCSKHIMRNYYGLLRIGHYFYADNCIDLKRLDSVSISKDFTTFNFLIFGGDYYRKGLDVALDALRLVLKEYKNVKLNISCSMNYETITKLISENYSDIKDNVCLFKSVPDISLLYSSNHVLLSPSRAEGFPATFLEACYCGMPVICSNIRSQKNKKLPLIYFRNGNSTLLATKMLDFIKNKDKYQNRLKNNKNMILENFSIEKWSNNIYKIIKEEYDKE